MNLEKSENFRKILKLYLKARKNKKFEKSALEVLIALKLLI